MTFKSNTSFYIAIIFLAVVMVNVPAACIAGNPKLPVDLRDVLGRLDDALAARSKLISERKAGIDSIKIRLRSVTVAADSADIFEDVARSFERLQADSALKYYDMAAGCALRAGDPVAYQRLSMRRGAQLPVVGAVKEGIDLFESAANEGVYPANREIYYESGNRLYLFAAALYPRSQIRKKYLRAGSAFADSLQKIVDKGDVRRNLMLSQRATLTNDTVTVIASLNDVLDRAEITDNTFARASSELAEYYASKHDISSAAYFYGLAALSDAMTGTLEGVALLRLGSIMYDLGEIDTSYKYLNQALGDAVVSGSRIRALEASQSIPRVSEAFRARDQRRITWLTVLAVCMLGGIVAIVFSSYSQRKEIARQKRLRMDLAASNEVKDACIGKFLTLLSLHMEKIEEFLRMARRKVSAGQVDDLYSILKSDTIKEEQSRMFFEIFDSTFLSMYPDFVHDVNELLMPGKRLVVPERDTLTTELRILALLRLGIDDGQRVSRFLGLSLNTIYTYRNKLRARAVNRETFEQDVMAINSNPKRNVKKS